MKKRSNKVRIISGTHRGRLIHFADQNGLRPTGDRLRESLFSWLQPLLPGSRCLDMFAGSGVLGFESISRGAEEVIWFEKSVTACDTIKDNARSLGVSESTIVCADCLENGLLLQHCGANAIDIAFIDPPFSDNLQQRTADELRMSGVLADDALIVVESAKRQPALGLPSDWSVLREKVAGDVRLQLFRAG